VRDVGKEWNYELLLPSLNDKRHTQRVLSGHLEIEQGFRTEFPQRPQNDAFIRDETVERKQQGGRVGATSNARPWRRSFTLRQGYFCKPKEQASAKNARRNHTSSAPAPITS